MTREPLPQFDVTVTMTVRVSAADESEAKVRVIGVEDFLNDRLSRSTFRRLPGMPSVEFIESGEPDPF